MSFEKTVTLGRQDFWGGALGRTTPADAFFRDTLGARKLDAIDASDFEGASIIHDLNEPIPEQLHGQYTAVFDGGTLEHIFNAPQALMNVMALVADGGYYLGASPANNQMGHGFYQFSPEFYYRAFSEATGFRIAVVALLETRRFGSRWFHALDPAALGRRFQIQTHHPVEIFVAARRIGTSDGVSSTPQQSDYVTAWGQGGPQPWPKRMYERAPSALIKLADPVLTRGYTSWSNGGFRKTSVEHLFDPPTS